MFDINSIVNGSEEPKDLAQAKIAIKILITELERVAVDNIKLKKDIDNLLYTFSTTIDKNQSKKEIIRLYEIIKSYKSDIENIYKWAYRILGKKYEKL